MGHQNLSHTRGAAPIQSPGEGFEPADSYEGGATQEIEVPEDIMEEGAPPDGGDVSPAEGGEPPSAPEGEGEGEEELAWDVEGVGRLTAEDIRNIVGNQADNQDLIREFQGLKDSYETLQRDHQELSQFRDLKRFFERNPDIRRRVEAEVGGEFGTLSERSQSQDPLVRELQSEVQQLRQFREEVEARNADAEIDHIFGSLKKDYPEIVDEEFQRNVLSQVYDTFKGDPRFGAKTLAATAKATAYMLKRVHAKGEDNGTGKAVRALKKPGVVRLAPAGTRKDAAPPKKNYRNMTEAQIAEAMVDEGIFGGER